jgi:hypothetical protein
MVGKPEDSVGLQDTVCTLVEEFDDFKESDGLALPRAYRLHFTIEGQNETYMADWNVTLSQIGHNQQIDSKYFNIH